VKTLRPQNALRLDQGLAWPYRSSMSVVCLLLIARLVWAQGWWPEARVTESLAAGQVDWTTGVVRSSARAEAASGGGTPVRRASTFAAAAQVARQRLHTAIGQLRLDAGRTVESALQEAQDKRQELEALVAAAEVVHTRYLPQGTVESTVQLPLFGRLAALLWPEAGAVAVPVAEVPSGVYTGIVIDARGLALQPALFPRILDEDGQVLYAPESVQAEVAMQQGYVTYISVMDSPLVQARVGTNPLLLRAHRAVGPARVNVMMSRADGSQLQHAAVRLLLAHGRVIIVA
jgi:hypothetical protein